MKNILVVLSAFALFLTSMSCNKSSLLGADLFDGEKLNLLFTDTLTINAVTENTDSVVVYPPSLYFLDSMLCGKVNDPIFGLTEASIYSQFQFDINTVVLANMPTAIFDSVVLDLGYAPTRFYGDTTAQQTLSVYRMTQEIPVERMYSNRTFTTAPTPLGKVSFLPEPTTKYVIRVDTVRTAPRIRIRLDDAFGKLLMDTTNLKNATTWLKGLAIKADNTTNCMLGFNFGQTNGTGIRVYYRKDGTDTSRPVLFFPTNTLHVNNFKNGYEAAPIKPFINNQKAADSLMFIQGMAGTNVKIEFPYLKTLGKVVVNNAELELTVAADSKTEIFPAIDQLLLRTAQFSAILDVKYDSNSGEGSSTPVRPKERLTTAGGTLREETVAGTKVKKYYFTLSSHLQQMLDGKQGSTIYITPHFKEEKASRVVVYGPKSSKYRAKVNLHYTKL